MFFVGFIVGVIVTILVLMYHVDDFGTGLF